MLRCRSPRVQIAVQQLCRPLHIPRCMSTVKRVPGFNCSTRMFCSHTCWKSYQILYSFGSVANGLQWSTSVIRSQSFLTSSSRQFSMSSQTRCNVVGWRYSSRVSPRPWLPTRVLRFQADNSALASAQVALRERGSFSGSTSPSEQCQSVDDYRCCINENGFCLPSSYSSITQSPRWSASGLPCSNAGRMHLS